jgi:hypothetical protein
MVERTTLTNVGFIERYTQEYPPSVDYIISPRGEKVSETTTHKFKTSRIAMMQDLVDGKPRRNEMSHSLFAEEIVCLALDPLLQRGGFSSCLAPQSLEHGVDQKGVDVLISDKNNMAYLGIDVKLRIGKSLLGRDGFGWSHHLLSPYIYLSLGNWSVDTWEENGVNIRGWLADYALPKIPESGKIPKISELRRYLIDRIERSLSGFMDRVYSPKEDDLNYGMPSTAEDLMILEEKLPVIYSLFFDLKTAIC